MKTTMSQPCLFLTFWHLCLDNFPEGAFARRRMSPEGARSFIEEARREERLLCVSQDDLLAPYKEEERRSHEALCKVLSEDFGIALSLRDFAEDYGQDDPLYSIRPLQCAQVQGQNRLLVITCAYALPKRGQATECLRFEIAPDTVAFHLFEALPQEKVTFGAP